MSSSKYTPDTAYVREQFSRDAFGAPDDETAAEFDRWLAQHDAELKAEALREYAANRYEPYLDDPTIPWPQQPSQLARQYAKAIEELRAEADRIHPTTEES